MNRIPFPGIAVACVLGLAVAGTAGAQPFYSVDQQGPSIGCAAGARSTAGCEGSERRFGRLASGRERGSGALTGSVRQTGYSRSMPDGRAPVNDCGLFIEAWLNPR